MLLQDFSGGKNTRVAPSLLAPNEAQIYENIDGSSGSIVPLKDNTLDTSTIDKFFTYYYAEEEFVGKTAETSFVEYRGKLYFTQLSGIPQVYDGTTTKQLGITPPGNTPSVTGLFPPAASTQSGSSGDLTTGVYKYQVKWTAIIGGEVEGGYEYVEIDVVEGEEVVIDMSAYSAYFSVVVVYREYEGTYRLVSNTGLIATDDTLDISAEIASSAGAPTALSYCYTYYNSATGLESAPSEIGDSVIFSSLVSFPMYVRSLLTSSDPQVTHIRVYRLGGALTSYTLLAEIPTASTSYVDILLDIEIAGNHVLDSYLNIVPPSGLKYLTEAYAMLFGATDDKLYYSNIAQPSSWPATNFIDFEGDITGIGVLQIGLVVFTEFKAYLITGNSPDTFSKQLLDGEQGCLSHYTIQFIANSLLWLSQDGICTTAGGPVEVISLPKLGKLTLTGVLNAQVLDRVYYLGHSGGILAADFRHNLLFRDLDLVPDWLGSYKDTLFISKTNNIYSLFTGADLTFHYKSPVLTEGAYSQLKSYKDFYIKYNGNITIKLYVDGTLVNTKVLTGDKCENLKALDSASGYGLEIDIEGTGIVSEIEYKVLGRENGR